MRGSVIVGSEIGIPRGIIYSSYMPDDGTRAEGNDSRINICESVNFAIHSLKDEGYMRQYL